MSEVLINSLDSVIKNALDNYSFLSGASIRLLNKSENTTFVVEKPTTKNRWILRLSRPGYHTKTEIEAELQWMKAIRQNTSIIVPEPVAGNNGDYVQSIPDQTNQDPYYYTLFTFLDGIPPDENNFNSLLHYFRKLGEITAHLHNHVQQWVESNDIARPEWDFDTMLGQNPRWGRWQDGPDITSTQMSLFKHVVETISIRLKKFGKTEDRFGLIHADLRLANLLIDQEQIKVLDFDDSGYSWFLYDLASALSFIEHKPYIPALIAAWLTGYESLRVIPERDKEEIPTFIMLRRLLLLAWLGTHENSETAHSVVNDFTLETEILAKKYLLDFGTRFVVNTLSL